LHTRRSVLGLGSLAALGLLSGCTRNEASPSPSQSESPTAIPSPGESGDPDLAARRALAGAEVALIAMYDAVLAKHPELASSLRAWRDHHQAHAAAILPTATPSAGAAPTAPGSSAAAVKALRAMESELGDSHQKACATVRSADLARVLALCGASESAHAELLGRGRS